MASERARKATTAARPCTTHTPSPLPLSSPRSVEAYLTAHFCIARVLGKRIVPQERVRDTTESLREFQWLIEHAEALIPEALRGTLFAEELQVCREMAALLPSKISRMHYGGETFGMF